MSARNFYIVILCIFTLFDGIFGQLDCNDKNNDFFGAQIILFFAPMYTVNVRGQIAIYYYNQGFRSGDMILFKSYDLFERKNISAYYSPATKKGFIYTNISASYSFYMKDPIYKERCLGHYGSWIRNGVEQMTTCMSTRPDWMFKRKNVLSRFPIQYLMIPGTHNSGSYSTRNPQTLSDHYAATHDRTVLEQLVSGARYLDLRPAYRDKYWVMHGSIPMNPMHEVIDDVINFMNNTNEIVILSFKEFPAGFSSLSDHSRFIQYLLMKFAGFLLSRSSSEYNIKLGDIWRLNRRLIICYDHKIYKSSSELWPMIDQWWGDVRSLKDLKSHLEYIQNGQRPRVDMAEFTLDAYTVMIHGAADIFGLNHTSLLELGTLVGPYITEWYNELFFESANIIAVDYMDATGIVDVAIDWNDRRASLCYNKYKALMKV